MLKEDIIHALRDVLPPGRVLTDRATLISYEVDAGLDKGIPVGVVFPRTEDEVMDVMRWASAYGMPLIARGAGTGLSGGAVADRGGMIVEFVHMNCLREIDALGRSAVVEPALINLRLDERAQTLDLYFPPDPSSQRASTMGGNVAENSGGPHCFKYGVTTNYVTGMNVVLANGQCIKVGGRAFDYPEYDFCGLITGSEGMLGLITSISLRLLRRPPAVKTLLAVFNSVEEAGNAVSAIIAAGLTPATMEMMDQQIVRVIEPFAHANLPLDAGAILIVEFDGYARSLSGQVDEIIAILQSYGGRDMRVARDEEERARIWLARKSAAGAIAREYPAQYTIDITVPRSRLAEMLVEANRIGDGYRIRMGHVFHAGDGNLHPNLMVPDPDDQELMGRIHASAREIAKSCVAMGGSITGEHGVGIEKRDFMLLMHNPAEMLAMWDIKQVFDPQCILNPGKIFPPADQDQSLPYHGYVPLAQLVPAQPEITVEGYTPTSPEQAAQQLQALSLAQKSVTITSAELIAPPSLTSSQLSTSALRGIKVYAPDDLYITVGAATPLSEIQQFLYEHGQHLPLASPWSATTIGGLAASNLNAPLRMRYGAIRDIVLCATVALADGRVIRTGRPLVKNVAGFDLTKVFVGSYGTLGVLIDLSLKVLAQPRVRRTLMFPVDDLPAGLRWAQELVRLALTASAVVLASGPVAMADLPASPYVLAYTVEGMREDVEAELSQVQQALHNYAAPAPVITDALTGTDLWMRTIRENDATDAFTVRIGVPVKDLALYMERHAALLHNGSYVIDFASGLIYVICHYSNLTAAAKWLAALHRSIQALDGYVVLIAQPEASLGQIKHWNYQPASLEFMQRLKKRWDPQNILNPHTFVIDEESSVFKW